MNEKQDIKENAHQGYDKLDEQVSVSKKNNKAR